MADDKLSERNSTLLLLCSRCDCALMTDLIAIERPRAELHATLLLVERKVLDVDGARTLVDRWRNPQYLTVCEYHHIRLVRHLVLAVSTAFIHA